MVDNEKVRCCIKGTDDAPKDSLITFEYLNKGAANVVFKIHPWSPGSAKTAFLIVEIAFDGLTGTPVPYQEVANQVLRVSRGRHKHLPGEVIIHGFETDIRPLFVSGQITTLVANNNDSSAPSASVTQVPITLPRHDLGQHLMDHQGLVLLQDAMAYLISKTEANTFEKESGEKSPVRTRLGILLPDMSPASGASITLELKPKWLLQSPNAPRGAVRCRTCAMQVANPKDRQTYLCPLRLVAGNKEDLISWAHHTVGQQFSAAADVSADPPPQHLVSSIIDHLLKYITNGDGRALLHHLRFLQKELDPQGALYRDSMYPKDLFDHNLRLAMTLRDCSLFIKVPYNAEGAIASQISSKLGDLDFKSAEKIVDWTQKELSLQAEQMYTKDIEDDLDCWFPRIREPSAEETEG
ncbi:inositol-pentakisphosphate 2-kinase [Pyrenochaeta sp. MPI-SDFR-AT-0127]|nr:inositol-pentakisphosphate 2-kinase [Pyrenochaeta sp. MPI-SDFR-AT-0127]